MNFAASSAFKPIRIFSLVPDWTITKRTPYGLQVNSITKNVCALFPAFLSRERTPMETETKESTSPLTFFTKSIWSPS